MDKNKAFKLALLACNAVVAVAAIADMVSLFKEARDASAFCGCECCGADDPDSFLDTREQ